MFALIRLYGGSQCGCQWMSHLMLFGKERTRYADMAAGPISAAGQQKWNAFLVTPRFKSSEKLVVSSRFFWNCESGKGGDERKGLGRERQGEYDD